MKTSGRRFLLAFVLLSSLNPVQSSRADNEYSINIVGYANILFYSGDNLFGNPLDNGTNTLSTLFSYNIPDGSTASLWNPAAEQFLPASTYHLGVGWDADFLLPVGIGALFHSPSGFTNTFVGSVLLGPGGPGDINPPPPPLLGPGLHLISSLFPVNGRTFQDMIGRNPVEGEYVKTLNPITQTYLTTTFHNGNWDNGAPSIDIAQGAFFNLVSPSLVPEPGSLSLLMASAAALLFRKKRRSGRNRSPSGPFRK